MAVQITTVIPTFRRPQLLRRAIQSVLNQTYPHVLVCVYDNASGDDTEAVVTEMRRRDSRIRYHRHPENIGSYPNFNYGIRHVETPFFSLLSDDDLLAPEFYEEAIRALRCYPQAMMACMPTLVVDTQLNVISRPLAIEKMKVYAPGEAVPGMIAANIPPTWTGILFRTEVRNQIGVVDTDVGPQADGGYVYYAAARFPVVAVPGIGAVLMAHDASSSGTVPPMGTHYPRWWNAMLNKIAFDEKVSPAMREFLRNPPHQDYRRIGVAQVFRALARGDYPYARQAARGVAECGYPMTGRWLSAVAWCSEITPLRGIILALRAVRRFLRTFHYRALQRKYGHLVEFTKQRDSGQIGSAADPGASSFLQQPSPDILPPGDRTPKDYVLPAPGATELFVKRPLRRLAYPIYKFIVGKWLSRRYQAKCNFAVDQWLWGQRGNDFEAHRRRIDGLMALGGKNILIAGCGTGRDISSWLPYRPASVTGVDYFRYDRAWSLLNRQAAGNYPQVKLAFVQSDLARIDCFARSSFDLIGSDAVFEHIRDLPPVLSEANRLLKPGGVLYATYGPLWYCWGGDHISGYDAISSGYNHLVLDDSEYSKYLDTLGTFSHSEHDGRTWINHDLFSYLRPLQYLEALEQAGFQRLYIGLIIEPRAVKCLSENPILASRLLSKHAEFDLIVTGMTIIYRKPDLAIHS